MTAAPGRRRRRRRSAPVERYLPLVQFTAVAVLAVVLLPSALRPPQQNPNQTAELSPDAPPDKDQQAIISSLNRAQSGVATDEAVGGGADTTAAAPSTDAPPTTLVPRACPGGVGDPPRQVESVYSAPCAAPWSGDNGGATSKGVTATEIRIGVRGPHRRNQNGCKTNGRLDDRDPSDYNSAERTFKAFQTYFNRNFQFYGRTLAFYCVEPETQSVQSNIDAARAHDSQYKVFGLPLGDSYGSPACDEYARLKVISFCDDMADGHYQRNFPYMWGGGMGGTEIWSHWIEYWCKKLNGKKAEFGGEDVKPKDRKFGIVAYDTRGYQESAREAIPRFERACGIKPVVVWVNLQDANGEQALATAVAKFRAEDVTTIGLAVEYVSAATLTNAAQSASYYPEWFVGDWIYLNWNQLGQLSNQAQMAHAFGISGREPEREPRFTECYRAYRSIDPTNDPFYVICDYFWRYLPLFFSAIQMAGPNLTPETFAQALFEIGHRYYTRPTWAVGGGYAPGVLTYAHDATEIWWDPTATDPNNRNGTGIGAYRHTNNAKRYCLGQWPSDTSELFVKGVATPVDAADTYSEPPLRTCRRA